MRYTPCQRSIAEASTGTLAGWQPSQPFYLQHSPLPTMHIMQPNAVRLSAALNQNLRDQEAAKSEGLTSMPARTGGARSWGIDRWALQATTYAVL